MSYIKDFMVTPSIFWVHPGAVTTHPNKTWLHTSKQQLGQNINENLCSQKTHHTSPTQASCGISIVRIFEKTNLIRTALHCTLDKNKQSCYDATRLNLPPDNRSCNYCGPPHWNERRLQGLCYQASPEHATNNSVHADRNSGNSDFQSRHDDRSNYWCSLKNKCLVYYETVMSPWTKEKYLIKSWEPYSTHCGLMMA